MIVLEVDRLARRVKLIPESSVDLINVYRAVEQGDKLYSFTTREIKKERADGYVDSERIVIKVGIEVEKKSLDPVMKRASFLGRVVYVSKRELDILKRHHTIHLSRGQEIEVESRERFDVFYELAKSSRKGDTRRLLCISLDDESIAMVTISDEAVKLLKSFSSTSPGKQQMASLYESYEQRWAELAEKALELLNREKGVKLVLLGPSPLIEQFEKYLKSHYPAVYKALEKRVNVAMGGYEGIRAAIKAGVLGDDFKPLRDAIMVGKVLELLSKGSEGVSLGLKEVSEAVKSGTLGLVLVSEDVLWEKMGDELLETVLREAERGNLELRVVLSDSEAASIINGFGGLVGIPLSLTYKVRE